MKLIFWLSLSGILYAYVGYAAVLWLLSLIKPRPPLTGKYQPNVSIIMAAHNEAKTLQRKISNLFELDYPKERIQIVIASDGSSDGTAEIILSNEPLISPVILDRAHGKAAALNEAVKAATGEILIFFDVRQRIALNAISELVKCFADPDVGAASGELLLESSANEPSRLGIYWKIEKFVRKLESVSGSVVGVTGAIYAIRRELYVQIPPGTILDDVFVPMNIVRAGKRVTFCPSALAYDQVSAVRGKEFSRKVRTLTGNYQLLDLAPWLLTNTNPIRFRFFSHKLARLTVPFLLVSMIISSFALTGVFYQFVFWAQISVYALAFLGATIPRVKRFGPAAIALTFVMLNVAAGVAFYNFVVKRYGVWV